MELPAPNAPRVAPTWRKRFPEVARFVRSPISVIALCGIISLILLATFGPLIWRHDPNAISLSMADRLQAPSAAHPFGTDYLGRDLLARVLVGARISLAVGVVSMCINCCIGVTLGMTAGWFGGWRDTAIMRIVDSLYSIPLLLVVIILQIFLKPLLSDLMSGKFVTDLMDKIGLEEIPLLLTPDMLSIFAALGVANWLTMSRLTRSEVMNQRRMDYVSATVSLGSSAPRVLFRHILPNTLGPLMVAATLAIPEAIFIESFLAFIGLGVAAPNASWGTLANEALQSLSVSSHELLFPALAISLTMLAFNLFGDGLRDALDPSGRH